MALAKRGVMFFMMIMVALRGLSMAAVYKVGDSADNPIATYVDGSDNITLKSSGEYYFLCGFPGHCQAGMKLHITVNSAANSPQNPTPNPLASNVAPSLHASKLSCLVMVVAAATLPFFLQL
ncbi:Phytocyanin domain - like 10, partial [Theobroma cacao]